jgi:hypothetical protein
VIGVVEHGADGAQLAYVNGYVPVLDELIAATGPVPPTLVYRFAAPCASGRCIHFDGQNCQLAARIVEELMPRVEKLPACAIRKTCRWHMQEGAAACLRCPQVVTQVTERSDPLFRVAMPPQVRDGATVAP